MRKLLIRGELKFGAEATIDQVVKNTSSGNLVEGDVVVLDPANCTSTLIAVTTTSSDDDLDVYGMLSEDIVDAAYGKCLRMGLTDKLKVNGSDAIVKGDKISTYASVGLGAKATTGKGGVFAIALEDWSGGSDGVIDALLVEPGRVDSTAGGNSLDGAYDQPTAGGGRAITVNDGAITMTKDDAGVENVLEINGTPSAGADGDGILITMNSAATGVGIQFTNTGSGNDVAGSSDTWTISKAGVAVFDSINTVGVIKIASDTLGTGSTMIGYDGTDFIINALTGKSIDLQINDTNVVTITGSGITFDQAVTVSTGGIAVTGNSTITGDLTVTGSHTWASSLTVNELILDTDGVAPGNTICYVVRDNTGDITVHAVSGREVQLAIAGNDEFSVSATEIDIKGNNLILDSDGNTYLDCGTGDTIKIYVGGAQDFTIEANKFSVLSGSTMNLNDGVLLEVGTDGDTVLVNTSAGVGANTSLVNVLIGTPVNYATAADSLILSNVTASGDIQLVVNKGGHSQTVLFADASAGDVYVNAASAASVFVAVANVTEYTFDSSYLTIASGNNIKFAGADGILDATNASLIKFTATGSAANYLQIINAIAADPITLQCLGTDDRGFMFEAVNNEEILELIAGTGATTYLQIASANNAPVLITATGETNTALKLDTSGTGNIIFSLGGTETLAFHDASITLAAATGIAGHPLLMQTEDGGTASSGAGQAGGAWEIRTGDGTASDTGGQVGGAGGALTLVSGLGHTGSAAGVGGAGGAIAITAGAGGTAGTGAAGAGGTITLTAGAGGGVGGGTTGIPGSVVIGAGVLKLKVQTIAMANTEKVLTLDPTDPVLGVLLTGNILYVSPGGGGSPVLRLPDEDDCDGLFLEIVNTTSGAEPITIQSDSAGSIVVCTQNETAYVVCDGTTWRGTTGIA